MDHTQGNCPACHKPFAPTDDVVTCPQCGAPYHRACYQQTGHCLFEDKHGAGFEYTPAPGDRPAAPAQHAPKVAGTSAGASTGASQNSGGVLCKNCSTVNDARNIFCENCGQPLRAAAPGANGPAGGYSAQQYSQTVGQAGPMPFNAAGQPTAGTLIDDIPVKDWMAYVGPNAVSYLQRISFLQLSGRKVSFMLSAFLFSPLYFAYRKRWGWAALTLGITLLLTVPTVLWLTATQDVFLLPFSPETLDIMNSVSTYLSLAMQTIFGIFALQLYRTSSAKHIHSLRQQHSDDTAYFTALGKAGGVSILGVAVVVAVIFAFSYLFTMWGGAAFSNAMAEYYLAPFL